MKFLLGILFSLGLVLGTISKTDAAIVSVTGSSTTYVNFAHGACQIKTFWHYEYDDHTFILVRYNSIVKTDCWSYKVTTEGGGTMNGDGTVTSLNNESCTTEEDIDIAAFCNYLRSDEYLNAIMADMNARH